ncbi:MAG: hypothetical protein E6R04_06660 [Spirochaetes bacterium]|nr:MAG: hypothetical protein E6R04_06660 [Spirochaetota bacterium]
MTLTRVEQLELASLQERYRDYLNKDWLTPSERQSYDAVKARMEDLTRRQGDTSPPTPTPSTPPPSTPPPLPASTPFRQASGRGDGHVPDSMLNEPPVTGVTKYLPLTGNTTYDTTIKQVDAALDHINNEAFRLNPDEVWHYDGARLGGTHGNTTIRGLSESSDKFLNLEVEMGKQFAGMSAMWDSTASQMWTNRMREAYRPVLKVASDGTSENGAVNASYSNLVGASNGIQNTFLAFHEAIRSSRDAIESLYGVDEHGRRYLDTTRSLRLDPSVVGKAQQELHDLEASSAKLKTSLDDWNIPTRNFDGQPSTGTSPSGGTGGVTPFSLDSPSTSPGGGAGLPGGAGAGAPGLGMPGGMPGGMPMGMPGGVPGMMPGQMPFLPADTGEAPGDTHLSADTGGDGGSALKDAPDHKPDVKPASAGPDSSAAMHGASAAAIPRPGDPVRPGALGADGKLLDKDGDGKMDADAVAATKENMDRNGDGLPDGLVVTVDTAERSVDVELKDPRIAEMMQRLSTGTAENPVTILDAAAQTDLEMSDYGTKIDTLAMQPGDVVTGTDTGMYMGKGMVLTESGLIKPLTDVMDFDTSRPEVFRMSLPDLPSSGEVLPPAVEVSDTVPVTEPSATNTTPVHDVTPAPAPPVPPVETATTASVHHAAPPVDASATTSSADDLPEEVPYQGYPMG